jgi:hypothetical protein
MYRRAYQCCRSTISKQRIGDQSVCVGLKMNVKAAQLNVHHQYESLGISKANGVCQLQGRKSRIAPHEPHVSAMYARRKPQGSHQCDVKPRCCKPCAACCYQMSYAASPITIAQPFADFSRQSIRFAFEQLVARRRCWFGAEVFRFRKERTIFYRPPVIGNHRVPLFNARSIQQAFKEQ